MFTVWIDDGSSEMPDEDIFYIVTATGTFLKKKLGFFESLIPVDKISILEETDFESYAKMDIAKIPAKKFAQVVSLFKAVYAEFKAEANIILHYNPTTKNYKIDIPPQGVSGGGVEYVNGENTYEGYIRIGTIHSHANFSAFHSSTDTGDEENWDGLHITIGHCGSAYQSLSVSIMANEKRFDVSPQDYIDGIELIEFENTSPSTKTWKMIDGKWIQEEKTTLGWSALELDGINTPKTWMKKIAKYKPKPVVAAAAAVYKSYGGFAGMFGGDKVFPQTFNTKKIPAVVRSGADPEDWNPCEACPYSDYKISSTIEELLKEADDDILEELLIDASPDLLDKLGFNVFEDEFGVEIVEKEGEDIDPIEFLDTTDGGQFVNDSELDAWEQMVGDGLLDDNHLP